MTVILQPQRTLDDALRSMETFRNGCDFRLRFDAEGTWLEYGCYGVHVNLVNGDRRLLWRWLSGEDGKAIARRIDGMASPEVIAELKVRRPCALCGGFIFANPENEERTRNA